MNTQDIATQLAEAEVRKFDGEYEEAIFLLEELLAEDPDNVTVLEEIAENELHLARYQRAARAARRALRLGAIGYMSHYVLGFVSAWNGDVGRAVKSLKIANDLAPHTPEILRCLGYALFMSEDRASGLVTLERALNLDPQNVQILCTLASVYLHAEDATAARRLYSEALTLDPWCFSARQGLRLTCRSAS